MLHFHHARAAAALTPFITSVQTVEITMSTTETTKTATIAAVDTRRTAIIYNGVRTAANSSTHGVFTRVDLTNATTVTATRDSTLSVATTVSVMVVEFSPKVVKRIQSGTITLSGATTNTATITSVNTARAIAIFNGQTTTVNTIDRSLAAVSLTNSTTVTATKADALDSMSVRYLVIEFYAGVVDSIQQVAISIDDVAATSQTASITSVTTSRTMLFFQGTYANNSGNANVCMPLIYLSSSTQLTAERDSSSAGLTVTACVAVVQFKASLIRLVQRGRSAIATSSASNEPSITTVNMAKTVVSYLGFKTSAANQLEDDIFPTLKLKDVSTLRLERGDGPADSTAMVSWEVVEFR